MDARVALRAPAKLNLSLEVLNRQDNGLHTMRSVMVPVDLCDEILIEPNQPRLYFSCDDPALAADNLVARAYRALGLNAGATIELRKRIPIGAGLGGGSSDAAAILLAAQRGAFGIVPQIDYLDAARTLGSDVPFFLVETAALVEGTGERVTALGRVPLWHAVIVKPPIATATADAYQALDQRRQPVRPRSKSVSLELAQALQRARFDEVAGLLQNDFLDITIAVPEIAQAVNMLRTAGAAKPMLTGSGSAVFALARDAVERETIIARIAAAPGYRIFGCAFWSGEAWTH